MAVRLLQRRENVWVRLAGKIKDISETWQD